MFNTNTKKKTLCDYLLYSFFFLISKLNGLIWCLLTNPCWTNGNRLRLYFEHKMLPSVVVDFVRFSKCFSKILEILRQQSCEANGRWGRSMISQSMNLKSISSTTGFVGWTMDLLKFGSFKAEARSIENGLHSTEISVDVIVWISGGVFSVFEEICKRFKSMIFLSDISWGVELSPTELGDTEPLPPFNFGMTNFEWFVCCGILMFCESGFGGSLADFVVDKWAFANSERLLNLLERMEFDASLDFCPKILGNLNFFACTQLCTELRCFNKSVRDNGFESYLRQICQIENGWYTLWWMALRRYELNS